MAPEYMLYSFCIHLSKLFSEITCLELGVSIHTETHKAAFQFPNLDSELCVTEVQKERKKD